MHIKCVCCGAVGSLDLLIAAEDGGAEAIQVAGRMEPELWKIAFQYMALFRPQKSKLSWLRVSKLLGELQDMVEKAEFERGGKVFNAPLACWLAGLEKLLSQQDKINRPLKNHAYLLEIMMSLDAKSIREAEKKRMEPVGHSPPPVSTTESLEPPKDLMTKEEARRVFESLLGKTNSKYTNRTIEDPEVKKQQTLKELDRRVEQKQQQEEPK